LAACALSLPVAGYFLIQQLCFCGTSSSYGYDQAGRLITATVGMTQASYIYDGDGLRQSKIITTAQGVSTTPETWSTVEGLPLLLQDGMATYVTGPDGLPLEAISGMTAQYLLYDQLGSTRGILNSSGSLVGSQTYDPYGNLKSRTGTTLVPFGFAGQLTDAETGFQYLRARYYDPATAQFLTRDPLAGLTQQPYAYTADDPLNALDLTGLCTNFDPLCWSGQAAGEAWNITSGVGQFGYHVGRRLYRSSPANAWTNPNDYNYVWRQNTAVAGVVWDKSAEYARGWGSDPGGQAGRTAGAIGETARDYGMSIACKVWTGDEGGAFVDIFATELSVDSVTAFSGLRLVGGLRAGAATVVRTGTVWDSIAATQPVYEGSVIPRSFELSTDNGRFWVHGNATEHLYEYAKFVLQRTGDPQAANIATQAQLTSLQAAVNYVAGRGIVYDQIVKVGGWELEFGAPKAAGQLPVLYHALLR